MDSFTFGQTKAGCFPVSCRYATLDYPAAAYFIDNGQTLERCLSYLKPDSERIFNTAPSTGPPVADMTTAYLMSSQRLA